MSSSQFKTKEFKQLQSKWYKKLTRAGFDDIEKDEDALKLWSSHEFIKNYNSTKWQAKEEYYRLAGQFLHSFKFKVPHDRFIWKLHSQGVSVRNIIDALHKKGITAYKDSVHGAIKRLAAIMIANARQD